MTDSTDHDIHQRINELVDTEHKLRAQLASGEVSIEDEQAKLDEVSARLDQLWDLLRQREALREAGENPDGAELRSENTVERYKG
jgi:phage terminase Nu1 subunit (DNA packaging protein)